VQIDSITPELLAKEMMQGANIPLTQVQAEICPQCQFRTDFCLMMMETHTTGRLKDKGVSFVCKGMRHYVNKSN
jgi:hypothetical protein